MRALRAGIAAAMLLLLGAGGSHAGLFITARNIMVPMRDGAKLATDIYFPFPLKKSPAILIRTVYGKNGAMSVGRTDAARFFARRGYVVLVQNVRGRGWSQGNFYPFIHDGDDGADTIAWIGGRPWFDGRLATMGLSFLGIAQWLEAPGQDIQAMYGMFTSPDLARVMYRGGQLNLLTVFNWAMLLGEGRGMNYYAMFNLGRMADCLAALPVDAADDTAWRNVGYYDDALDMAGVFASIDQIGIMHRFDEISAPLLSIAGWYDIFLGPQLLDFQRLLATGGGNAGRSVLIVGPWGHGPSGDGSVEFANSQPGAAADESELAAWFDYWVRGAGAGAQLPPVLIYVMGADQWRSENEWPLARTVYTPYYLHSGGSANTGTGDGVLSDEPPLEEEPHDSFTYDPLDPVPTLGGNNLVTNVGPYDQRPVEQRQDVLCYTTGALAHDMEVTGPISAVLYAATDAPDTDFTAKLVDVYPDGRAINIQDGIVRALYRTNDPVSPAQLTPGAVERYEIDLWATSLVFKQGHRIRVEISSSNFPRYNRNLNTGALPAGAILAENAHQRIYHGANYPSHLLLPVIPAAGSN